MFVQGLGHTQHPGSDKNGIGQCAKQHNSADVLAAQPLAQHECVLRANGNDQSQAEGEGLKEDGEGEGSGNGRNLHTVILRAASNEGKLSFLHPD